MSKGCSIYNPATTTCNQATAPPTDSPMSQELNRWQVVERGRGEREIGMEWGRQEERGEMGWRGEGDGWRGEGDGWRGEGDGWRGEGDGWRGEGDGCMRNVSQLNSITR